MGLQAIYPLNPFVMFVKRTVTQRDIFQTFVAVGVNGQYMRNVLPILLTCVILECIEISSYRPTA
jgi:hypothetical protein